MDPIRRHVLALLEGGQAYDTFDSILAAFTADQHGIIPAGADHSAWQIVEHMRVALQDILDFSTNEDGHYIEKEWPADYWPTSPTGDWDAAVIGYRGALAEMKALIADGTRDLFEPFAWGNGQTLLREALLAADHAAYHLGQLVQLKRWLDAEALLQVEQKA